MLNISYSKLLKLSFVVLLATVFIMSFTKNVSYAYTLDEFVGYVNEHKEEMTTQMQNRWNYITSYFDLDTLSTYWKDSNAVTMYAIFDVNGYTMKTVNFNFIYYDNDNGRLYNSNGNLNIENKTQNIDTLKVEYNNYSNTTTYTTGSNTNAYISSATLFNSNNNNNNRTTIIVKDRDLYTSATGETVVTGYNFVDNYIRVNGPQFIKVQNYLNYNNRWHNLGRIEGDDLSLWRVRAELFDNEFNLIGSWHMISNEENGLNVSFNNYNYEDNNIYIYALTSYLYTSKPYYFYLFYDNDDNLAWEEIYYFSLNSGDNGYSSQNSTNDIINNQNQNTNDIINAIESGNNNINDFLTSPLNLSGESISSGDIIGALDMNFVGNPYQNVWTTLIDGLRNCLVGVDREFDIEINNKTYTISLDSFTIKLPGSLKTFLTLVSTSFMIWVLIRWIKLSIDKIQTANIDSVMELNEEEGIIDLF